MDKMDRILLEAVKEASKALPLDEMRVRIEHAERREKEKRRRRLQYASMAAMLVLGLGLGALAGRSPMFSGDRAALQPAQAVETAGPAPAQMPAPEAQTASPAATVAPPDSTVVERPGGDAFVLDPPNADGDGMGTVTFVMTRQFASLPRASSVKKLLPGWLPASLKNEAFTVDASMGYWRVQNQDDPEVLRAFDLYMETAMDADMVLTEDIIGKPPDFRAQNMPIGTGFLLRYEYGGGAAPWETWQIRVNADTYVQCYGTNIAQQDVLKIIENLGK